MPYNPGITNREGDFLFNGITGGATAKANGRIAGSGALASGIASAGNSIAGTIGKMGEEHEMTEKELTLLNGKAAAYHEAGAIATPDYQKFMDGNINAKRQIISQADATLLLGQHSSQQAYQGAQTAHLNAVTAGIPAQTEHVNAITEGIRQTTTATQDQIETARRNKANLDAWTKGANQANNAAPLPQGAATPAMTAADAGLRLNPGATNNNPFNQPITMKQLYGYY